MVYPFGKEGVVQGKKMVSEHLGGFVYMRLQLRLVGLRHPVNIYAQ
jgi:hypothetical protein